MASRSGIAVGLNHGHVVTSIPRAAKPVDRKGVSFCRPRILFHLVFDDVDGCEDNNKIIFPAGNHPIHYYLIHPSSIPLPINASIF